MGKKQQKKQPIIKAAFLYGEHGKGYYLSMGFSK